MTTMQQATLRGTVYGTLLNHHDALAALGSAVDQPPYKAAPKAPILYIKPRNTWIAAGQAIVVPAGVPALEMGATLGLVIGRPACRVSEAAALDFVAGYVIVNDVSMPHDPYYRPSLRFKARDSFCPIDRFVACDAVGSPDALGITVAIDGKLAQRASTTGLIRSAELLLAEVSDFITLAPGDMLSVGVAAVAPHAQADQQVCITIDGLGQLENPLVSEGGLA